MGQLDTRYGSEDVAMDQVTDTTHFLRSHDRERLQGVIDGFENQFPQLFPAFYLAELPAGTQLTEFVAWLLNRAKVPGVDSFRDNEYVYLFVIDLTSRAMTVAPGYFAEQFVSENDLRELLSDAGPYIEAGDLCAGLEKMVNDLRMILRRNHRLILKSMKFGKAPAKGFPTQAAPRPIPATSGLRSIKSSK